MEPGGISFALREQLGGSWEQQHGHDGIWNRMLMSILVLFLSFLCTEIGHSYIHESNFGRFGHVDPGFRKEGIARTNFSQKLCFMDFGVENSWFFSGVTDPESGEWLCCNQLNSRWLMAESRTDDY